MIDQSEHRAAARERFKTLRKNRVHTKKGFNFITYHKGGELSEVRCRLCGEPIKTLVADDRYSETMQINGKTVVRERMVLTTLPGYREILILFDDGSKNVTHVCAECLRTMMQNTTEKLEEMYAADLAQWKYDEDTGRGPVRWDLMAYRKPIKYKVI